MTDTNMLRSRATEVRRYLERGRAGSRLDVLRRFPVGCCKPASLLLMQWLRDQEGLQGIVGVANAERVRSPKLNDESVHFWLEIDGWIVDITADQFGEGMDPVYVSRDRTWHDTFSEGCRFTQSDLVPRDEDHLAEYELMRNALLSD